MNGFPALKMPSGNVYSGAEVNACHNWWKAMEQSGRWWMITEVYPQNQLSERVRVAMAPVTDKVHFDGSPHIQYCVISNGSCELEARIHVMRKLQAIVNPK